MKGINNKIIMSKRFLVFYFIVCLGVVFLPLFLGYMNLSPVGVRLILNLWVVSGMYGCFYFCSKDAHLTFIKYDKKILKFKKGKLYLEDIK
jgi:hypothetical protein